MRDHEAPAERVRIDVVEPADHLPAAARQPRIARHRDAVGHEVLGAHGRILGHLQVAERPVEVPDAERHAVRELVLQADVAFPVVLPLVPAVEVVGVEVPAEPELSETALIDGAAFPVRRGAPQVAIGKVVFVQIVPVSERAVDRRPLRVSLGRDARGVPEHVPAQRRLEGRPPVAGQIPGHAQPRADVMPIRQVGLLGEAYLREEEPGGPRRRRSVRVEVVVAHAEVQRDPVECPLILREYPQVRPHVGVIIRLRGRHPEPHRHPVAHLELNREVRVKHAGLVGVPARNRMRPDLEGVRAGHVAHGEIVIELPAPHGLPAVRATKAGRLVPGAIYDADPQISVGVVARRSSRSLGWRSRGPPR